MTNASLQEGNRVFYLSRHRVIYFTLGVFLLTAFVASWAANMVLGRLWEITWAEVSAILCLAVGGSVIFYFVFKLKEVKPTVAVTESGLIFKKGKKVGNVRFADIASVRENGGLLGRISKTRRIEIETHLGTFAIYLAASDVSAFFEKIPVEGRESRREEARVILPKREKYICFLSYFVQLTILFALAIAVSFPAVAALLGDFSESRYYLFALLAIYGVALLAGEGRYLYIAARFAKYSVRIEKDRFTICYGKITATEHNLFFDSILAFRVHRTPIDRLFGLYRVSAESAQKAKGISDNNYFPFLLRKEAAEAIVYAVMPERPAGEFIRAEKKIAAALLESTLWFVLASIIMGIFLTPWMLLLLVLPIVSVLPVCRNAGYILGEDIALFRYGMLEENILLVRYRDIKSLTGTKNITASRFGISALDVTVGQYTRFFSVGYVKDADFSELTEKLEKKVDKDC